LRRRTGFTQASREPHRSFTVPILCGMPNMSVLQPERLFEPGRDLWKHFGNGEL
jgi:hypothetical protein